MIDAIAQAPTRIVWYLFKEHFRRDKLFLNRLPAVPISEAAILPRLILLSSVCFSFVSEETLKRTMCFPTHQPSRSVAAYSTEYWLIVNHCVIYPSNFLFHSLLVVAEWRCLEEVDWIIEWSCDVAMAEHRFTHNYLELLQYDSIQYLLCYIIF